jgi:dynein heavy chain
MLVPASKRMNWLSVGVMDFVSRCSAAIDKFASVVHQVKKNTEDIEQRLATIESCLDLFNYAPRKSLGELPDCEDYFDHVVETRAANVKALVRCYQDIGQILTKVCGVISPKEAIELSQIPYYGVQCFCVMSH